MNYSERRYYELRAGLERSRAGTIYLNGLHWAYRHGGLPGDMYKFAGDFLDKVVLDSDNKVDGHDLPEVFAAEHANEYPYVLDVAADALLHADKLDPCLHLLAVGRLSRGEVASMMGLAPVTVDLLLDTWEQQTAEGQ